MLKIFKWPQPVNWKYSNSSKNKKNPNIIQTNHFNQQNLCKKKKTLTTLMTLMILKMSKYENYCTPQLINGQKISPTNYFCSIHKKANSKNTKKKLQTITNMANIVPWIKIIETKVTKHKIRTKNKKFFKKIEKKDFWKNINSMDTCQKETDVRPQDFLISSS